MSGPILRCDGRPDVEAQVTRVRGSLDRASRTMMAEIELDNAGGRWLPGALCNAVVRLATVADAVTVPTAALDQGGAEPAVWIVDGSNVRRQTVRTGLDLGERVQVVEGLFGGERVVVTGKSGLRDGTPVIPNDVEK